MYNTAVWEPSKFAKAVKYVTDCLKTVPFDVLVFRGFSGAVIGPTVALRLKKPWALVPKVGDNSHSSRQIEGKVQGTYVIIDDFIDSGDTIRAIKNAISETSPKAKCGGVVFYEQEWCNNCAPSRECWEGKIGGLPVLNWRKKKPRSESAQCA